MSGGEVEQVQPGIPLSRAEILRQSFDLAVKSHDAGDFGEAEKLYRAIVAAEPRHADALHGLGVLAHQVGRGDLAENFMRQAMALRGDPTFFNNLGLVLLSLDRPNEAMAAVFRALELRADYPEAFNALGAIQKKLGVRDEAIASYRRALALKENYADAAANLGSMLMENGDLDAATPCFEKALALAPDSADALNNYGNLLRQRGRIDEAVAIFDRALAVEPTHAAAYSNRGVALAAQRKLAEAAASFRCAFTLKPDFPEALNGCGAALSVLGRLEEAIDCYDRSLALDPEGVEALNNKGAALMQLQRTDEAVACLERAIAMAEGGIAAASFFNLGNVLLARSQIDDAIASYRKAVALAPDHCEALNNIGCALHAKGEVAEAVASFDRAHAFRPEYTDAYSNRLLMMHYLATVTNDDLFERALAFGRMCDRPDPAGFPGRDLSPGRRLRIGYVSGDFNLHPVAFFLARALAAHDRANFELVGYSSSAVEDHMTAYLRAQFDRWRAVNGKTDAEAAAMIRADGIDILVDLAGHTNRNRLPLFGLRPAPVQASWLGYWGTTGLETMDYVVLDPVSASSGADRWFREAIVRLPHGRFCYRAPDFDVAPNEPPCLTRGHVTFGSFNNVAKITSEVLRLWAAIMRATPESRIVLKWKSLSEASARRRLLDAFERGGVSADRVELRGATPFAEMLAEYNDIDLALDTFPFGGGATSCEALWMGVPVVTLPGDILPSRQTLGFLAQMGLTELAASSPEDYVARAVSLANDPERLADLRRSLRPAFESSPLCDGPKFTRTLEAAYREMWRRFAAGEKPAPIDIAPLA